MANTRIQIKRSSVTTAPTGGSLAAAEPAYSYLSEKLFIGSSDGSGSVVVGGKFFIDQQNAVYDLVNSAFTVANVSYTSGNSVYSLLNLTFNTTNSAYTLTNANFNVTNAAYTTANAGYALTNLTYAAVNSAFAVINSAFTQSNTDNVRLTAAFNVINAAYTSSNADYVVTNAAFTVANAAFGFANASNTWVNSTFVKLTSPNQTITGDLAITGNLVIAGDYTTVGVKTLAVNDSLIYLANNNFVGDIVDIGFVGNYSNGTSNVQTGLYRSAGNKQYYLFQAHDLKLGANNTIIPYANNMVNAVLNADLITSNLVLGGANAIVWIKSAYDNSNGAFGVTNSAFGLSNNVYAAVNSAFAVINAAYTSSNADFVVTNAAFTVANAAFGRTNSVYNAVNSAFAVINSAFTQSNTDNVRLTSAYVSLNAGYTVANAAFAAANLADIRAANASYVNTGTLLVNYGGTGRNTFTTNGILYGNGTGGLLVTTAGVEGNVLQVNNAGVPQFGMLDGGNF